MNPTFRQCATGVVIAGNAWWLGINTAGNQTVAPQFDPPTQALAIESFNQDRAGQDMWRWSGRVAGSQTVVRLQRGDCVEIFLPGGRNNPSFTLDQWAPGDWDHNGAVNSNDISAFLSSWVQSVGSMTSDGDFNVDGVVSSNDISAFLTAWLTQ